MIILSVILVGTIWGLHKVCHKVLSDQEVQLLIFNDSDYYTKKARKEQHIIVNNAVHVATCVLLLVFLLVADADIALLYVLTQVFTCTVHHTELTRSEHAILVTGGVLYWSIRSPHAERIVYYAMFSLPVFSYRMVEHHIRGYSKGWITLQHGLLVTFAGFWMMSLVSYHRAPNLFDTALIPVTFYLDVVQWDKILTALSTTRNKLH
tara:strand:+ start:1008 stop:1628 length:621 start_codon:yes stop_codon:yes gene_type:complete